jgi:mRNA interferase MazF
MFKRGQVYYVELPESKNGGSVQGKVRPCVIVSNEMNNKFSPTLNVVSLTSKKKDKKLPTHVDVSKEFGLDLDSKALCEQPFTVGVNDIKSELICTLPDAVMIMIDEALKIQLNIKNSPDVEFILDLIDDIAKTGAMIKKSDEDVKQVFEGNRTGLIKSLKKYCDRYSVDYKTYINIYNMQKKHVAA